MTSSNDKTSITSSSIIVTLDLVKTRCVSQLPIIFLIFGFIGFIGDAFTFLQPNFRRNTFCIYTLCGSLIDIINLFINLLPNYIYKTDNILLLITTTSSCKWKLFGLAFVPQLSMNLLILSLIDRYVCTCSLRSPLRKMHQVKVVPYLIGITVIISGTMSLYSSLLYDVIPGFGCVPTDPLLNGILYIILHGFLTSFVMSIFVWLTYRNIKQSRQRVRVVKQSTAHRSHHQFITTVFTQVILTSFFVLQWIGFYIYHVSTQFNNKTAEQWAIHYFILLLTNDLYYINNVKSFYLSTLASRLFRKTFLKALRKLMSTTAEQRQNTTHQQTLTNTAC